MITQLTKEEIKNLSVGELASRMDEILKTNKCERYGPYIDAGFPNRPSVGKILNTHHVQAMDIDKQRTVCYLTFSTLLQIEYTHVASGASNLMVYDPYVDNGSSWSSPSRQINSAALNQFKIISSRISMECFMQLLHYLGEGEKIRAKRSTFRSFKKWLNDPENPFSYFAVHILKAYYFDRNFRTPEVHASSKLTSNVLRMEPPDFGDSNALLELANIVSNVWRPLVDILNDGKTYTMYGSDEEFKWLESYLHDEDDDKAQLLESIFQQMQ